MSFDPDRAAVRRRQLGDRLRARRAVSELTQERLALAAGLDRSFYVEVESGKHSLSVDRLFAVAEALGVTASSLLDGIE